MPLTIVNDQLKTILAKLRSQLETHYGDRLAQTILFGSQARGDARLDSDIDVLVVLKGEVRPGEEMKRTSQIRADLSPNNDVVISLLFMDEKLFSFRGGRLLRNIRKEGIAF
jgi:predicted nucleotidyltransferase